MKSIVKEIRSYLFLSSRFKEEGGIYLLGFLVLWISDGLDFAASIAFIVVLFSLFFHAIVDLIMIVEDGVRCKFTPRRLLRISLALAVIGAVNLFTSFPLKEIMLGAMIGALVVFGVRHAFRRQSI